MSTRTIEAAVVDFVDECTKQVRVAEGMGPKTTHAAMTAAGAGIAGIVANVQYVRELVAAATARTPAAPADLTVPIAQYRALEDRAEVAFEELDMSRRVLRAEKELSAARDRLNAELLEERDVALKILSICAARCFDCPELTRPHDASCCRYGALLELIKKREAAR